MKPELNPRLKDTLDELVYIYNQSTFIHSDPISIPHRFTVLQDIEIIGLWTAILSWGLRKTIINKASQLCDLMDHAPYDFILNHHEKDRVRFFEFKHRTFNTTDTIYFLSALQQFYKTHHSLEEAFIPSKGTENLNLEMGIDSFRNLFFSYPNAPYRTRKHIPSPLRNSTCKRLNMFLRWMVRKDDQGVDFGIWKKISMHQLFIPLDVHVETQARKFGLLKRKQRDWKAVLELTEVLRRFDSMDPTKYDFALFGLGVMNKNNFPMSN